MELYVSLCACFSYMMISKVGREEVRSRGLVAGAELEEGVSDMTYR
jgi:hypothetical protein